MKKIIALITILILTLGLLTACSGDNDSNNKETPVLRIGAIPDQDVAKLSRGLDAMAEYLSQETGFKVEFVPSSDYAALVTAFGRGDIHLAWFGGLTGVQARSVVPDAQAIAQRPIDEEFKSVFIKQAGLDIKSLTDLKGKSFTFGSESSTSGHLMPRYFLMQEGIDASKDFNGNPNFSGSHDTTYKLVESGAFETGALNISVWEKAVEEKKVDINKVEVFYTTPAYYDYNWTINSIDAEFGEGAKNKVKDAILALNSNQTEIVELFQTDKFIETKNENYNAILNVAKELGIIK